MNEVEIGRVMATLAAAYPASKVFEDQAASALWARNLAGLRYERAMRTVRALQAEAEFLSSWAPFIQRYDEIGRASVERGDVEGRELPEYAGAGAEPVDRERAEAFIEGAWTKLREAGPALRPRGDQGGAPASAAGPVSEYGLVPPARYEDLYESEMVDPATVRAGDIVPANPDPPPRRQPRPEGEATGGCGAIWTGAAAMIVHDRGGGGPTAPSGAEAAPMGHESARGAQRGSGGRSGDTAKPGVIEAEPSRGSDRCLCGVRRATHDLVGCGEYRLGEVQAFIECPTCDGDQRVTATEYAQDFWEAIEGRFG